MIPSCWEWTIPPQVGTRSKIVIYLSSQDSLSWSFSMSTESRQWNVVQKMLTRGQDVSTCRNNWISLLKKKNKKKAGTKPCCAETRVIRLLSCKVHTAELPGALRKYHGMCLQWKWQRQNCRFEEDEVPGACTWPCYDCSIEILSSKNNQSITQ